VRNIKINEFCWNPIHSDFLIVAEISVYQCPIKNENY
jgi:hypothetical protein